MRIFAGEYKGRHLKTTTGPGFRPAMGVVRESLFSMLEARGVMWEHTRVLDLFAGSGSLGFEALSRGAEFVCFVDAAPYAVKTIEQNAETLQVPASRCRICLEKASVFLGKPPAQPYSLVFIDPPYQLNALAHTLKSLLQKKWLEQDAIINAEIEAKLPFSPEKSYPDLPLLADRTYGQTRVLLWGANQL